MRSKKQGGGMSLLNSRESLIKSEPSVLKGLAAGAIGGLVASWVMDKFQYAWMEVARNTSHGDQSSTEANSDDNEPATVKAAEMVSQKIFGHQLAKDEKKIAGDAVHYATGATSAAVYGIAAEFAPEVTAGAGIPFGTAVWLFVDEGAVPLLRLSKGPTDYPLSSHLYALASHFVYGVTTEVVRRTLRRSILS
jgi:putative membrane protein